MKRPILPVCLVMAALVAAPRDARAGTPITGDAAVGLALLVAAGVILVAPIGAMVTTLEGEPTKEWGRTSLVVGGVATTAGTIMMIAGSQANERDRPSFYIVGGIGLGIGLNALGWGIASEATLPAEDPGIAASPRPSPTPAGLMIRGRFP